MKKREVEPSQTTAKVRFSQGHALLRLASFYPRLHDVVLEIVQNALDKDVLANAIEIVMDYKTRILYARDNGRGTTTKKFNSALETIATPKRKGDDSLGQFALGLISPLGVCKRFTFISCPAPFKNAFQEWTFDTDLIINQASDIEIPVRTIGSMNFKTSYGKTDPNIFWRSEMKLFDITDDVYVSNINMDKLIAAIIDRYGTTMYRNKVTISITIIDKDGLIETRPNITAGGFKGIPLPEVVINDSDPDSKGQTTFRLFVAKQDGKNRGGKVLMGTGSSDFRFPFHYFVRFAAELLDQDVINALSSGLFEGEIISKTAQLHPSRRTFEKNDHFIGLCMAIEEWFETVGAKHLGELKNTRQAERHQELGLRSIGVIENLLKDPRNSALQQVIDSFKFGTIGIGHVDVPPSGNQGYRSKSIQGVHGGGQQTPPETPPEPPQEGDPEEKKNHRPLTVAGTEGEDRKKVKNSSFGLQLKHEAMFGSPDLWKLDCEQGVLIFNIRHPLWTACDEKSDSAVMKLQEYVVIQALTLHLMPENLRVHQRQVLDEVLNSFVSWILIGDRARSVRGANKKTKTR